MDTLNDDMVSRTEDAELLELYRSDRLVVRQVRAGNTDNWVVTFDNYGIGHGFDRPGFGQEWLRANQISAIHVLGRAEDWYQYEDIEDALATVRAAVEGAARVMTYGSSMGGYAAIRFADAVGAKSVLALSPQYTLDPRIAGHDRRWSQDAHRIRWRAELNGPLECRAKVLMVYDPSGLDGWHGDRIAADAAVDVVRLPYTAHPVTSYLSEIGALSDLVTDVLHDRLDVRAFQALARARRGASGVYLGELAGLQPPRRSRTALSLARRAVAANPINHHARLSLARLQLKTEPQEALEGFTTLVADSDRALTYLVSQGQAMATLGRTAEARAIAAEVIERAGPVAHLHGWAAHMNWLDGDTRQARRLIRRAIQLDRRAPAYLRAAFDYHLGRHRSDVSAPIGETRWLRLARWMGRSGAVKSAARAWFRRHSSSEPATGS